MYKLIACDLDETLLSDDRSVSNENIEAIRLARQKGVKFVPATGRGFKMVQQTLEELSVFDAEDEYVISFNGGAITENKGEKILAFHGISFETAEQLFNFGLNYNVCIHVYTDEHVYIYGFNEGEKEYIRGRVAGIVELDSPDLTFIKDKPFVKVLYQNCDLNVLHQIEEDIREITDGRITVSFSSNRYIEFNQLNVDKGSALLELAEKLGIRQEETIAIGDNLNDLSMILAADLGVCVKNAVEEMKPQAQYVCEGDYNEHAVAEVINKFILNKD